MKNKFPPSRYDFAQYHYVSLHQSNIAQCVVERWPVNLSLLRLSSLWLITILYDLFCMASLIFLIYYSWTYEEENILFFPEYLLYFFFSFQYSLLHIYYRINRFWLSHWLYIGYVTPSHLINKQHESCELFKIFAIFKIAIVTLLSIKNSMNIGLSNSWACGSRFI